MSLVQYVDNTTIFRIVSVLFVLLHLLVSSVTLEDVLNADKDSLGPHLAKLVKVTAKHVLQLLGVLNSTTLMDMF